MYEQPGIENRMKNRCSCRAYDGRNIEEDILKRLLDTAVKAPSASGFQNYSIIKVQNSDTKEQLARLSMNQSFIRKAPVVLVFCIDLRREYRIIRRRPAPWKRAGSFTQFMMHLTDAVICAQTLCMAAEEEGMGTVFIGNIIDVVDQVDQLLSLPRYVMPAIMVCLGYPKGSGTLSPKYGAEILVHDETYRDWKEEELLRAYDKKYEGWKMKPTPKMMEQIFRVTRGYNGTRQAEASQRYMKESGRVDPYQFYFGIRYLPGPEDLSFAGYRAYMKKKGFSWLCETGEGQEHEGGGDGEKFED